MDSLDEILAAEEQAAVEKRKWDEIWQFIQDEKKKRIQVDAMPTKVSFGNY